MTQGHRLGFPVARHHAADPVGSELQRIGADGVRRSVAEEDEQVGIGQRWQVLGLVADLTLDPERGEGVEIEQLHLAATAHAQRFVAGVDHVETTVGHRHRHCGHEPLAGELLPQHVIGGRELLDDRGPLPPGGADGRQSQRGRKGRRRAVTHRVEGHHVQAAVGHHGHVVQITGHVVGRSQGPADREAADPERTHIEGIPLELGGGRHRRDPTEPFEALVPIERGDDSGAVGRGGTAVAGNQRKGEAIDVTGNQDGTIELDRPQLGQLVEHGVVDGDPVVGLTDRHQVGEGMVDHVAVDLSVHQGLAQRLQRVRRSAAHRAPAILQCAPAILRPDPVCSIRCVRSSSTRFPTATLGRG